MLRSRNLCNFALFAAATVVASYAISAEAAAVTANFDDLTLPGDPYWSGPANTTVAELDQFGSTVDVGSFASHGVTFVNRYNAVYQSWDGFAYSRATDTTTVGYSNPYSAIAGSGAGDAIYGLAYGYMDGLVPTDFDQLKHLPHLILPDGATIVSALVTNSTWAALAMEQGYQSKLFGGTEGTDPDWFKLTVYRVTSGGALLGSSVDFYLADFTSPNSGDDYIVDTWTPVDLSSLAGAKTLYFNLTSSDVGQYGMNTPGYFAIDDIQFTPVPEPSTAALALVAGGLGISLWRRARRRGMGALARAQRRLGAPRSKQF